MNSGDVPRLLDILINCHPLDLVGHLGEFVIEFSECRGEMERDAVVALWCALSEHLADCDNEAREFYLSELEMELPDYWDLRVLRYFHWLSIDQRMPNLILQIKTSDIGLDD